MSQRICFHRTFDIDQESAECPFLLANGRLAEKTLAQDRQDTAHGLLTHIGADSNEVVNVSWCRWSCKAWSDTW